MIVKTRQLGFACGDQSTVSDSDSVSVGGGVGCLSQCFLGGNGGPFGIGNEFVEDSIDERRGLGGSEAFGEFQGFIDDYGKGRIGVKKFKGTEPNRVAIRWGHAADLPMRRDRFDFLVDGLDGLACPGKQAPGEAAEGFVVFEQFLDLFTNHIGRNIGIEILLKQHLEYDFSGLMTAG